MSSIDAGLHDREITRARADTSANYFLADHAYFCTTTHGAVFLDLRSDKYFGLSVDLVESLCSFVTEHRAASNEVKVLLDSLLEKQILTREASNGKPLVPVAANPAQRVLFDIDDETRPQIHVDHVVRLLRAFVKVSLMLRFSTLERAVESVRQRKHATRGHLQRFDPDKTRELIRIYRYLSPLLYSARDRCLFDSYVVTEFLAYYGVLSSWMFGVATAPFMAHCWVQHEEFLLNDNPMRVSCYTPIMVV
jgi:hypothetical protein